MSSAVQPVRGMNDILPAQVAAWHLLESAAREVLTAYGYEEMRVPVVEHTELFKRAIGEHTDVVSKEMYTFQDQGGDSLTLRPEATAGLVRAVISNNMLRGQNVVHSTNRLHRVAQCILRATTQMAQTSRMPTVTTSAGTISLRRSDGRGTRGARVRSGADDRSPPASNNC